MENLPQEVIIDILSRVPAKSVGKCRCVWKPWKSLLCQPHFIKTHLKKTQKQLIFAEESLLLVSFDYRSLYSTKLKNALHLNDGISVVATKLTFADRFFAQGTIFGTSLCNGLILAAVLKQRFFSLFLINPATKQVEQLPSFCNNPPDSCWPFPLFGIGYDSVFDDYKVVVLCDNDTSNKDSKSECTESETTVDVYSVRNGTWKRAESPYKYQIQVYTESGIYVDGYIHWVVSKNPGIYLILAFDLHKERFCEVPLPSSLTDVEDIDHEMFGGCLGVKSVVKSVAVDFWKMEEYGVIDSWTKFSIINPNDEPLFPLCFMDKQKVVLYKWPDPNSPHPELVMCNLKDKTFKKIVVNGSKDGFYIQGTFIESLVSPHRDNNGAALDL